MPLVGQERGAVCESIGGLRQAVCAGLSPLDAMVVERRVSERAVGCTSVLPKPLFNAATALRFVRYYQKRHHVTYR